MHFTLVKSGHHLCGRLMKSKTISNSHVLDYYNISRSSWRIFKRCYTCLYRFNNRGNKEWKILKYIFNFVQSGLFQERYVDAFRCIIVRDNRFFFHGNGKKIFINSMNIT